METIDILQGILTLITTVLVGIIGWFVKLNSEKIKQQESAKQEVQHTKQEELLTEEKEFELDSRRVAAAEEVASGTLEHLASTREENLKLLEDNYELRKAVVDLQFEIKSIKTEVVSIKEDKEVLGYFYCGKIECKERDYKLGTFHLSCISLRTLKEIMNKEIGSQLCTSQKTN